MRKKLTNVYAKKNRIKIILLFSSMVVLGIVSLFIAKAIQKTTSDPRSFASESGINRISIRQENGKGVFYDIITNKAVKFRGNNYIRVRSLNNGTFFDLSDFLPESYNHDVRSRVLQTMKADGYNSVRIFIDQWKIVTKENPTLSAAYLDNLADYLRLSKQHGMYVLVTFRRLPEYGKYRPLNTDANIQGPYHEEYLLKTHVDAKKMYVRDVVAALKDRQVPLDVVLGWAIDNEPYFQQNLKPMSLTSGKITTANGKTYDMSSSEQKLLMMEENFVYSMNEVRQAIKEVDPQALVGITFFSPEAADLPRVLRTKMVITKSLADFITINIYPGVKNTDTEITSSAIPESTKPVILSEYGAYPHIYSTLEKGADAMKQLQITTCSKYGFQGWFAYEWDTSEYDSWFRIYHVTEGNGVINKALAPAYRPDPCSDKTVTITDINGNFDSISPSGLISGWVYDREATGATQVNFYADSPYPNSSWSNFIGSTKTSQVRTDVAAKFNLNKDTVGFSYQIPAKYLNDGVSHKIYAQAVNILPDGKQTSYLVPNSGHAVSSAVANPSVITASCGSAVYNKTCVSPNSNYTIRITGESASSKMLLPTWNQTNQLDDRVDYSAVKGADDSWTAVINASKHPGIDDIRSNVWKFDAMGNQTWCTAVITPVCK